MNSSARIIPFPSRNQMPLQMHFRATTWNTRQSSAKERTFQELYCEEHSLKPKKFEQALFLRSLHLNGILCYPLLQAVFPGYFATDREFIRRLGASRSLNEAKTVYSDFTTLPYNESFFRRLLCIRVAKRTSLGIAARTFPTVEPKALPRRVQMPNTGEEDEFSESSQKRTGSGSLKSG